MSGDIMTEFISIVNTGLGSDALWGVVSELSPLMITFGTVALGYHLFRRLTKGGVKLKFRP